MRSSRRYHLSELWGGDPDEVYQPRLSHESELRKTTISFEKQKELEQNRKSIHQRKEKNKTLKHYRLTLLKGQEDYHSQLSKETEEFLNQYRQPGKNRWIEVPPIQPKHRHAMQPQKSTSMSSRGIKTRLPEVAETRASSGQPRLPTSNNHTELHRFMKPKPRVMFTHTQPKQSMLLRSNIWTLE